MSIALARKWRPKNFHELVGQAHVTTALIHSLDTQRLHHAYLFTGTRGVGKTSIARLFSKSLNCEEGLSSTPCGQCNTCLSIDAGHCIDVLEIDAASNTRVEDTKALLDNILYTPAISRYKIYLIDEVHMLSQHSFNALLKTLEEPPAHVKFLLATTDPQKLPETILSRCLQFHLMPIDTQVMIDKMEHILREEQVAFEHDALTLIAQSAKGSLRDALSLLEQSIAAGQGTITLATTREQLGLPHLNYARQIIEALAQREPHALHEITQAIQAVGANFITILETIMHDLQQLCCIQLIQNPTTYRDLDPTLIPYRDAFSPEDLQLLFEIALKGSQDIRITPTMMIGFEMTLLRMYAFMPTPPVQTSLPGQHFSTFPMTSVEPSTFNMTQADDEPWEQCVQAFALSGLAKSAIQHTLLLEHDDRSLTLGVRPQHRALFTPSVLKKINDAVNAYYQRPLKIVLTITAEGLSPAEQHQHRQDDALQKNMEQLAQDPSFQAVQEIFSVKPLTNSIEILKDSL